MKIEQDDLLRHMGYAGSVQVSIEDDCLHGRILHINDIITYEGQTPAELRAAFVGAVDRYLARCAAEGKAPNKPLTGSFNVRLGEVLHRKLAEEATAKNCSINEQLISVLNQHYGAVVVRRKAVSAVQGASPQLTNPVGAHLVAHQKVLLSKMFSWQVPREAPGSTDVSSETYGGEIQYALVNVGEDTSLRFANH